MKGKWVICGLFAACLVSVAFGDDIDESAVQSFAKQPPKLTLESSAVDVLTACREMLPKKPVELKGALILRNRRGIVSREYDYALVMRREPDISLMTIRLMPRGEIKGSGTHPEFSDHLPQIEIFRVMELKILLHLINPSGPVEDRFFGGLQGGEHGFQSQRNRKTVQPVRHARRTAHGQ